MEHILTIGAAGIVNKLLVAVSREIGMAWEFKDDLKKLQNTLGMIQAKMVDAEQKQAEKIELNHWLKILKDIAYEADDLLDSFSYEALRRQHESGSMKNKVLDLVSSSKKLKDINRRLDVVANDMGQFQLQTTPSNTTIVHDDSERLRRQIMSSANESETLEFERLREDDKNEILGILTASNTSSSITSSTSRTNPIQNYEKVAVISLVGVRGLGKTKLAQLVYDDQLVKKQFDLRIWVCVSEDFDLKAIFIKILESITQEKDSISNVGRLENKVRQKLTKKKYLLVLDDLRNEDAERWERLKSLLTVGAQGSKVLITTRRIQVADVVKGSIPPYRLKHLEDDKCWSIIAEKAFSQGGALKTSKMTNIGREIAKRCDGLLLAAKLLGSLMHSKRGEGDWLSILENDIWNSTTSQDKVIPALRLCYNNLSPLLKECLSYCSLIPIDGEFDREILIQLWMAEGFFDSFVQTNRSIEDVGNECFESLLGSSFLEGVKKNVLGDVKTWKMHGLVHDLAQAVAGDGECLSLKVSELNNVSEVRRLELTMDEELSATFPETISNIKKLRTLIVVQPIYTLNLDRFSSHMRLRVLHLGRPGVGCSDILYSNSKLRNLRCLNLLAMNFSVLTKFAESIAGFYNLQTLVLCGSVHVHKVLRNIESLRNLRHLDISCTDIKELPESVTSLATLQRLDLSRCKSLTFFPNSASGLKYLRFLDMSFTPIIELPGFISSLHNLQTLDLTNCSELRALPEYVTSLTNLRIFNFKDCPLVNTLPKNFGALTQLRALNLICTNIRVLPDSCVSLENLEFVNLFFCKPPKEVKYWTKLREFYYRNEGTPSGFGELVCLQTLIYRVRKNVLGKSEGYNGIEEIGNLNFLEELCIRDVQNVKDPIHAERVNLQGKQKLRYLALEYGEKLVDKYCSSDSIMVKSCWSKFAKKTETRNSIVLEALQPPTSLRSLRFIYYMGWEFPTWMCASSIPNLEKLQLHNCKNIKQLPAVIGQFPGLRIFILRGMTLKSLDIRSPAIREIRLMDMLQLEEICCSCPFLRNLEISNCKSLNEIPSFPSLQQLYLEKIDLKLVSSDGRNLTSLTKLFLVNVEDLVYFPVSILQNNRNLQMLSFERCTRFEGFQENYRENEVELFGSLQKLILADCPVLMFIPDLRRWDSLQFLSIFRCPHLEFFIDYSLKSLSFLKNLYVDFIQRNELNEAVYDAKDLIDLLQ